ncbi:MULTISPECIES: NAD(P)/FAD-dependent oxidoreductase [unclassified Rhizobium]|uniref:NAD(P)/FAD-dependent oxidoreductase n=1 Tax=unclassified Rhizobium TaxID=2613769 RepID=UPI001782A44F|nr:MULTISPECIES: FAD-dependent oxidoreductase [unclassified Rhizobium]MBD8694366.1 FAD-binding oxidoreductase [Rhizobium sp. CFBP 13717]
MTDFIVLGAGMVGVTTALALQECGHHVTIVDRNPSASEASYGNAGIIQVEATEPYGFPRDPVSLVRMAFGLDNSVNYQLAALPAAASSLAAYFLNSAPLRHREISSVYRTVIEPSGITHDQLIQASGAEGLIRRTGYIQMHRGSSAFDKDAQNAERLAREYGVQANILDNSDLRREEPVLQRDFAGAIHWLASRSCIDPAALVRSYADLFQSRGGSLLQGDATTLAASGAGWQMKLNDGGVVKAENIVVALGSWSPNFLRRFGHVFPMIYKRGYHRHYDAPSLPTRPLFDLAAAVLYCPMTQGLRLTTGAEIARFPNAPKTSKQLERGEKSAREVLDLGSPVEHEPWAGWRPCMPDMLPVIGKLPGTDGIWCNFGHGHHGFTLGPSTAQVLAGEISGKPSNTLSARFSPARFC